MPPQHGFTSPLRYPGGKGALANFVKLVVIRNGLRDGHYAEPYAGGAGIAWPLLFGEYSRHVHINDLSIQVYSFWRAVLDHTESLCRLISDTHVSMATWNRQRNVHDNPGSFSLLEVGFSTFFLNRTNRSGILTGGVIGGKRQQGVWKLDARFNKRDLIARIVKIARYRDRISLHNMDALAFMRTVLPRLPHRSLVYLDPPYFGKGKGLYENRYRPEDHKEVAEAVTRRLSLPWIVSYDTDREIAHLYKGHRARRYDLSYSAQSRYAGSETMFFSPGLTLPRVAHPAFVTTTDVARTATYSS